MSLAAGARKRPAVIVTATLVMLLGLWLSAPAQASEVSEPGTVPDGTAETAPADPPTGSEGGCDPATCAGGENGSGVPPVPGPSDPPDGTDPSGSGEPPVAEPPVEAPPVPDEPAVSPPDAGVPPTEVPAPVEEPAPPVEPMPPETPVGLPEESVPPVAAEPLPTGMFADGPPIVVVDPPPSFATFSRLLEMLDSEGSGSLPSATTEQFTAPDGRDNGPATSGRASEPAGPASAQLAPGGLSPLSPTTPTSPSPLSGTAGFAPGGSGGGFSPIFLAALVAALTVGVARRFTRRLIPLVAVWRPAAPVSPLERPG